MGGQPPTSGKVSRVSALCVDSHVRDNVFNQGLKKENKEKIVGIKRCGLLDEGKIKTKKVSQNSWEKFKGW